MQILVMRSRGRHGSDASRGKGPNGLGRPIRAYAATAVAALMAGGAFIVGVTTADAPPAAATVPTESSFTCATSTDFLVAGGQLYSAPEPTTPVSTVPVWTAVGSQGPVYNAMGFDPANNYLYALAEAGGSYNLDDLLEIDPSGGTLTNLGQVSDLPSNSFNSGGFDPAGNFWVTDGSALYEIDVTESTPAVTDTITLTSGLNSGANDMTYDYGSWWDLGDDTLYQIDPTSGSVTAHTVSTPAGFDGQANWTYTNGDIGEVQDESPTAEWVLITGLRNGSTAVLYGPSNDSVNMFGDADGASCLGPTLGSTVAVTSSENPATVGDTVTYTAAVTGAGAGPAPSGRV